VTVRNTLRESGVDVCHGNEDTAWTFRVAEGPEAKIDIKFPALVKILVFKNIENNCGSAHLFSNIQAPRHGIQ
jgi:hypothetical protein